MQAWDAAAHFSSEELNEWSGRHAQLHKNTHGTDQWKRLAHPGRFKRITSLTHFTAQRSRVELWPRHSWKCAGVYVAEKSLLFAISLSSVSGFLLHCSSISDLLGGWGGTALAVTPLWSSAALNEQLWELIVLSWIPLTEKNQESGEMGVNITIYWRNTHQS